MESSRSEKQSPSPDNGVSSSPNGSSEASSSDSGSQSNSSQPDPLTRLSQVEVMALEKLVSAKLADSPLREPEPIQDLSGLTEESLEEALQKEGITHRFLATKLRAILTTDAPKWNRATKQWDYFLPHEAWIAAIHRILQGKGSYAPERRENRNINVELQLILRDTSVPPEEARRRLDEWVEKKIRQPK